MKNKIVMVTGASAGIGQACAEIFAENGAKLILLARRKEKLEEFAQLLNTKYGTESLLIECDVRSAENVASALEIDEKWRKVDVLINNAGLASGMSKIQDGDLQDWEAMIDTNIKGLLYVSKIVINWMLKENSGLIINIASLAGREVYPAGNVYCATKHAVRALSRAMTMDLNGTGIKVTNLDPGLAETEFSIVRFHGNTEAAKKVYDGFEPLIGRDVAEAALFCASRPPHVCIQDILITPVAQASTTMVHRKI
ncbi:MAG: SDR family NAD(P)-dependent oxidoreductase [Candidatus Kapabacteria bacterium]|nr:SDR family NAD(P)-dependent oxidoreductase [Candidatus Kapabacteria bacterium]